MTPPTDFDDGIVLDNLGKKKNLRIVKDSHETQKFVCLSQSTIQGVPFENLQKFQ